MPGTIRPVAEATQRQISKFELQAERDQLLNVEAMKIPNWLRVFSGRIYRAKSISRAGSIHKPPNPLKTQKLLNLITYPSAYTLRICEYSPSLGLPHIDQFRFSIDLVSFYLVSFDLVSLDLRRPAGPCELEQRSRII